MQNTIDGDADYPDAPQPAGDQPVAGPPRAVRPPSLYDQDLVPSSQQRLTGAEPSDSTAESRPGTASQGSTPVEPYRDQGYMPVSPTYPQLYQPASTPVAPRLPVGSYSPRPHGNPLAQEPHLLGQVPLNDDGPVWLLPGNKDDISKVRGGIYDGRVVAGDVGGMLQIQPSIRNRFSGLYVPDTSVDTAILSESVSIGAVSVKGSAHHYRGDPRQDAYAIASNDEWCAIGVADGLSSGRMSHFASTEAARVAANGALRAVTDSPDGRVDWSLVAEATRSAVREVGLRLARQQNTNPGSVPSDGKLAELLATTCDVLVLPVTRDPDGSLRVRRICISGDGSFYVLDPQLGWGAIGRGKDSGAGTISNAVSDPLPMGAGSEPRVQEWDLKPGQAAVLCTDGFGDVIESGARPVGRYLFGEWQLPLDTVRLVATASFLNTNADDDRTAAIVWATR